MYIDEVNKLKISKKIITVKDYQIYDIFKILNFQESYINTSKMSSNI